MNKSFTNNEIDYLAPGHKRFLWILFSAIAVIILVNSLFRTLNRDEIEAIHSSWKVLNDGWIYADFFQNHHPLLYFLLAPVISLFGDNISTIFILRLIAFADLLLIFFVAYKITEKVFGKDSALICLLLLATARIFLARAIEVRPDSPMVLFILVSILFLFTFYEKRSTRALAISAFALGISFLFLQKALIACFLIGLLLAFDLVRRKISPREILIYAGVFLLTLAPLYAYIFYIDSFEQYILFDWKINFDLPNRFSPVNVILKTLRKNTLLYIFFAIGLWKLIKDREGNPMQLRIAFLALGFLGSVFLASTPNPQYFMPSMPFVAAISAYAVYSTFKEKKKWLPLAIVIIIAAPTFGIAAKVFKKPNSAQLEQIRYVLDITEPDDYVYDANLHYNLFRSDIDYFWFYVASKNRSLSTKVSLDDFDFDVYRSIEEKKPKVIADAQIDVLDPRITSKYAPSELYDDVFIRRREDQEGNGGKADDDR